MNTFQQIFDQSTDAVFGIDAAGRVRYTNSRFEKLLGYSREQASGMQCAGMLCGTDMQGRAFCGPQCPIPRSVSGQPVISDFDLVVKRADGETVMTNVGACYTTPQLREQAGGVNVFFSLRMVSSRRLMQRMSATAAETAAGDSIRARVRLTHREREILGLAAASMNTLEIANRLCISKQTVRSHFKNIYRKLRVRSRADAVVFTLQNLLN
jgi:DNA-binding CsgD family transcriptional regulator